MILTKSNDKKEKGIPYMYLVIFLVLEVSISIAGYQYHKHFEKNFRTNIENQLSLIADLKVGELEHWIDERRGDAETVFGNEVFSKSVKRYLKNPNDSVAKREIKVWMKEFQTGFNYDAVFLTDPQLIRRIIITEQPELPSSNIAPIDLDSLKSGKLVFGDFYRGKFKQKIFLKILIPILDARKMIGIIELRTDPKTYLYPILTNWPLPSKTSETFILRREGNEAVYLNELKFQKNSALNLRVPLENKNSLAAQAVFGHKGIIEGIGYRETPAIAYVKKVLNSPWYLVEQVDVNEVYAPLKTDLWETTIFTFAILLIAGMGFGFILKNQRSSFFNKRIKSAEALRESEKRFRSLYENSTIGLYRTTRGGQILLANDTLVNMLGYSSFEDLSTRELENDDFGPTYERKQFIEQIEKDGEVIGLEAEWKRKDGTPIFIRESARAIRDSNQKTLYYDGTIEDISEQKHSELERQVLYEIAHSVTTTTNLNELLKLIHHSLGKVVYAENCFVALHDQESELFSFPYFVDKYSSAPVLSSSGKGCTAYVFRTAKPLLKSKDNFEQLYEQNEVLLVGSPSASWIGIPLKIPSKVIGVLVLQHYDKEDVYSERDVQFLDSVGSQIALIIERKQAEEDLQNEQILLRTVIDNIPDSIYCKDIATRKTLANLVDLRLSGVKSEAEILGKTDFDFYPKELADGFFADDQSVLQLGQPVINREEYVLDENGQKQWLLTSKLPLKDKNENIIGILGIGRNITIRKKAEEALRENEVKLNVILQSTADGILAVDDKGKVIKTNKRFVELWQIPQSEIDFGDGLALFNFVQNQLTFADEFISKEEKLFNSNDEELDLIHFKDGRIFESYSAPLIMHDSSIGRVWSFRDITERKKTEEEIKSKNAELLKINIEKDKFFSIIAHDLRSPFNAFLGLTQIMAEELPSLTMAEIQEIAANMRSSAINLFRLLENLLEWARMQQGLIPFDPKVVELRPIVDESIEMVLENAKSKGIEITCDIYGDLQLFADMNMLQTIIRNLVSNAVKFTQKGGKISLSAKAIADKSVEISIKDSGIGMSPKIVDNLFRLDIETSRKGTDGEPSSGLGLLLCKEFVEKHGEKLWVESQEGKGSVFYFTIPCPGHEGFENLRS